MSHSSAWSGRVSPPCLLSCWSALLFSTTMKRGVEPGDRSVKNRKRTNYLHTRKYRCHQCNHRREVWLRVGSRVGPILNGGVELNTTSVAPALRTAIANIEVRRVDEGSCDFPFVLCEFSRCSFTLIFCFRVLHILTKVSAGAAASRQLYFLPERAEIYTQS